MKIVSKYTKKFIKRKIVIRKTSEIIYTKLRNERSNSTFRTNPSLVRITAL